MKILFLILLSFPLFAFAKTENCSLTDAQVSEYLKMDYQAFDQTLPDGGWRGVANKGCELEAVKLIETYSLHHQNSLLEGQTRVLNWHAGQLYALTGQSVLAVNKFKKSYDPKVPPDDTFLWNSYVKGSIAFLEKDMPTLIKMRDELRAANNEMARPNLKILESFVACFSKSYREAYNPQCK